MNSKQPLIAAIQINPPSPDGEFYISVDSGGSALKKLAHMPKKLAHSPAMLHTIEKIEHRYFKKKPTFF
ncbi:MAG: hypothetical protein ICV62_00875 [Cyanobacteria bacterium Co-bin13]|nr:hypothetical protein [Cyanobacteria bacterium Co-bin13]